VFLRAAVAALTYPVDYPAATTPEKHRQRANESPHSGSIGESLRVRPWWQLIVGRAASRMMATWPAPLQPGRRVTRYVGTPRGDAGGGGGESQASIDHIH
jgi:hypothetical protein